jgi:hypothetical protein
MVAAVTSYKVTLETKLSKLEEGQKDTKESLASISQEHHTLMEDDLKQNAKIDKIMFRLRIPIDDVYPVYHTWPQTTKTPDAELDKELNDLFRNDKHSRVQPQGMVVGSVEAPPPPQDAGIPFQVR